jgi:hypothetical protein
MKRIIVKTAAIMLILAGVIACGKEKEETNFLIGTAWKLAGIMDAQTGVLTEIEPKDCGQCYTFVFNSDNTAIGISAVNEMLVRLSGDPFFTLTTTFDDSENGDVSLFYEAISLVESYSCIYQTELRFFYHGATNYLLFKPQSVSTYPTTNIATANFQLLNTSCRLQYSLLKPDSIYLINSADVLRAYITCQESEVFNIDFEKYSLLFVRVVSTSGIACTTKQLTQTAPNEYILYVDITNNWLPVTESWQGLLIIPKIHSEAVITLNKNAHL